MSIDKTSNKSFYGKNILLSMTASGMAEFLTVPIDTVKVHMQANIRINEGLGRSYGNPIIRSVQDIYHWGGIRAFYRSSMASIGRQMLSGGIRMGLYDLLNDKIIYAKNDHKRKIVGSILQGAFVGVVSCTVSMPFDLVKTKVQAVQGEANAMGVRTMTQHVWNKDGFGGFYRGYRQALERSVSISVVQMPVYFGIQEFLKSHEDIFGLNVRSTMASLSSTVATTLIVYPIDMVKTQIQHVDGRSGTFSTMRHLVKNNGFFSLYRGASVGFVRSFPQFWLTSLFYENLKRL